MAYVAQAGGIPAFHHKGAAPSLGGASGYGQQNDFQPYQYQPYGSDQQGGYDYDAAAPQVAAAVADAAPALPRLARMAGFLGAAASLALIVGVGVWSYEIISRDVSGVPVVRAVEGPMRVQPADPGGLAADHQGLAVNAVAATGGAAAPADRLVLAPSAVTLTEDDQPLVELTGVETLKAPIPGSEADQVTNQVANQDAFEQGQMDALLAELTVGATPLEPMAETVTVAAVSESVPASPPVSVPASVPAPAIVQPEPISAVTTPSVSPATPALQVMPGNARSLRPTARPASLSSSVDVVVPAAASEVEADIATVAAGTRLAQLGAYESAAVARSEWDRIQGRFPDFFEGKQRVIQRAESGGRIFYRLRVKGFDDLAMARRFCSELAAGRAECIPVVHR